MNESAKKILIFISIAIIITICVWPHHTLKIKEVTDGNTIVLQNGATVRLLGVASTEQAKEELVALVGNEIDLQADQSSFFDKERLSATSVVYAYVLLPEYNYECINSTLLKKGYSTLVENCTDSIMAFKRYASIGKNKNVSPTPTPVKPINYEDNDIILPQYVLPAERKYSNWYKDGHKNLEMLEEACDFNLPYTKSFANGLAAKSEGDYQSMGIEQVCEIFDYCYNKWRYVSDPAEQEYVARASETIYASLTGDCDDFAVLLASCVLAIGGKTRITTAYNSNSGHAFAELDITEMDRNHIIDAINKHFGERIITDIATKNENGRVWMNLDWQASYPGGNYWAYSRRSVYTREGNEWRWDGEFYN